MRISSMLFLMLAQPAFAEEVKQIPATEFNATEVDLSSTKGVTDELPSAAFLEFLANSLGEEGEIVDPLDMLNEIDDDSFEISDQSDEYSKELEQLELMKLEESK